MPEELVAGAVTLGALLQGDKEYHAPLFQRQYVWSKKDHLRLWEDIREILDAADSVKFLGAIVLEARGRRLATEPESHWIVDGQQRLTTLYIFLCEIAAIAFANKDQDWAADITSVYLLNQMGRAKNEPKIRPTLLDRKQFITVVDKVREIQPGLRLPVPFGAAGGRMITAITTIRGMVREYCRSNGTYNGEAARLLLETILGRLKFVEIVLSDNIDAHQVFDSLNTAGQRLENKDLIRNEIFQKLSNDPQHATALHQDRWIPLEERLGDRLDGFFFPFTLIHHPTTTKSEVLKALRARWKDLSPETTIADVQVYVPAYDILTNPDESVLDGLAGSPDAQRVVDCLRRMNVPASTRPFTMNVITELTEKRLSQDAAVRCLRILESFLVRRALVGLEPTGLHAVFKSMWNETKGNPEKVLETIERSQTISFPDDAAFARAIRQEPLYRRTLHPYVLMEYERSLVKGDKIPRDISVTADHILPQKMTKEWEELFTKELHEQVIDTWANLVPLSTKVNSEKQRKSWSDVRTIFDTETYFKTTNRLAVGTDAWTPDVLAARAETLVTWALARWPKLPQ